MTNQDDKTCWDCAIRIGEECGIDGHEVYSDTKACSDDFEEIAND